MRVSCESFVRLQLDDQYGLLLGKDDDGEVFEPIGGVVVVDHNVGLKVCRALGITTGHFDKPPTEHGFELRFQIHDDCLWQVRRLFTSWSEGPERELHEALVAKTHILSDHDLVWHGCALTFAGVGEELAITGRYMALFDRIILRLVSVYDLDFSAQMWQTLQKATLMSHRRSGWTQRLLHRPVQTRLHFVSGTEIRGGQTRSGVKIASIAKLLLPSE